MLILHLQFMYYSMNPWIKVSPEPSMADADVNVVVFGLPSRAKCTIQATLRNGQHEFESFGVYEAGESGEIDLSKDESIMGSYCGVDKMGLFWSMDPSPANKGHICLRIQCNMYNPTRSKHVRLVIKDVSKPSRILLRVYNKQFCSIADLISNNEEDVVSKCHVTRLYMQQGTLQIAVKESNFEGTLFIPPEKGPFPAFMFILGAMANPYVTHSSLMSSHGFVTFNMTYFGMGDWKFHIDMDGFEKAIEFLRKHHKVLGEQGVSVVGVCKGGQFALCMAECMRGIKSVVAINPTIVPVHGSHQYHEKIWPGLDNEELPGKKYNKLGALESRYGFPKLTEFEECDYSPCLFTYYDRHDVPCLYVAALDDRSVPSEHYCNWAEKLLKKSLHPNYFIVRYPGAGHLLDPPYTPFCTQTPGKPLASVLEWGGSKIPHCKAQIDNWKNMLNFLNLGFLVANSRL